MLSTLRGKLRLMVEPGEHSMRLDQFLVGRLRWRSRTSIEQLISTGKVELVGRSARPSRKVQSGEHVEVLLPRPKRDTDLGVDGAEIALPVLHEDRWLVAVDKPAGIPVHPGGRLLYKTVITELHRRYRRYGDPERDVVPKLCHRLDLETSGVLLVAKADAVVAEVGRQLRERETIKEYLAVVHGRFPDAVQEVDAPIGPALESAVSMKRGVRPDGAPARTTIWRERLAGAFSLVRVRLHTGRRHQIRVHLQHLGHPIVGDKLYGLDEDLFLAYYEDRLNARALAELRLPRQALHAARIRIRHPAKDRPLEVRSPLPDDLEQFLEENPESA